MFGILEAAATDRVLYRSLKRDVYPSLHWPRPHPKARRGHFFAAEDKQLRISEQNLEGLLALGFVALVLLFLWPTL